MSINPIHTAPYTNFHDLNLDWIMEELNEFNTKLTNFVSLATIKYANPIQWDITSQYEANTVVVDKNGNAYLSVQPVPSGVSLDRTEFWTKIGNFDELWANVKKAITPIDEGHSTTATAARAVNDLVWVNGALVRVTRAMNAGDAYVPGSICVSSSTNEVLHYLITAFNEGLSAEQTAREDADNKLQTAIEAEQTAREDADNKLQTAIEAEQTARENADTQLQTAIGAEKTARENADKQLQTAIGAEKTARENADKQLQTAIDNEKTARENADTQLLPKINSILCIGDSYLSGDQIEGQENAWGVRLRDLLNVPATIVAENGGGWVHPGNTGKTFESLLTDSSGAFSDIVVLGGVNDAAFGTDAQVKGAVINFVNAASAKYPGARVHIGMPGNYLGTLDIQDAINKVIDQICQAQDTVAFDYIHGIYTILKNQAFMTIDEVHPNKAGEWALAGYVCGHLLGGARRDPESFPITLQAFGNTSYCFEKQSGDVTFFYNPAKANYTNIGDKTLDGTFAHAGIKIGSIEGGYIRGAENTSKAVRLVAQIPCYVTGTGNVYYSGYASLEIHGTDVYIVPTIVAGQAYYAGAVIAVQIPPFTVAFDTHYC